MSYFDVNQSQIRRIWRARRGAIRLGVHRSNLRLWGSESVNNPERPFNLSDELISQTILFLPSGELLALYIQWVMYLWIPFGHSLESTIAEKFEASRRKLVALVSYD